MSVTRKSLRILKPDKPTAALKNKTNLSTASRSGVFGDRNVNVMVNLENRSFNAKEMKMPARSTTITTRSCTTRVAANKSIKQTSSRKAKDAKKTKDEHKTKNAVEVNQKAKHIEDKKHVTTRKETVLINDKRNSPPVVRITRQSPRNQKNLDIVKIAKKANERMTTKNAVPANQKENDAEGRKSVRRKMAVLVNNKLRSPCTVRITRLSLNDQKKLDVIKDAKETKNERMTTRKTDPASPKEKDIEGKKYVTSKPAVLVNEKLKSPGDVRFTRLSRENKKKPDTFKETSQTNETKGASPKSTTEDKKLLSPCVVHVVRTPMHDRLRQRKTKSKITKCRNIEHSPISSKPALRTSKRNKLKTAPASPTSSKTISSKTKCNKAKNLLEALISEQSTIHCDHVKTSELIDVAPLPTKNGAEAKHVNNGAGQNGTSLHELKNNTVMKPNTILTRKASNTKLKTKTTAVENKNNIPPAINVDIQNSSGMEIMENNVQQRHLRKRKTHDYRESSIREPEAFTKENKDSITHVPVYLQKIKSPSPAVSNGDIYMFKLDKNDVNLKKKKKKRTSDVDFVGKVTKTKKKTVRWQTRVKNTLASLGLDYTSKSLQQDIENLIKTKLDSSKSKSVHHETIANHSTTSSRDLFSQQTPQKSSHNKTESGRAKIKNENADSNVSATLFDDKLKSMHHETIANHSISSPGDLFSEQTPKQTNTYNRTEGVRANIVNENADSNDSATLFDDNDPYFGFSDSESNQTFKSPTQTITSANKIKIISNILLSPSTQDRQRNLENQSANGSLAIRPIANSTMIAPSHCETPWRPLMSEEHNPHFLLIKNNSLPSVDQKMVLDATLETSVAPSSNKNPVQVQQKELTQQSILRYTTEPHFGDTVDTSNKNEVSLFDVDQYSPIKVQETASVSNIVDASETESDKENYAQRAKRNIFDVEDQLEHPNAKENNEQRTVNNTPPSIFSSPNKSRSILTPSKRGATFETVSENIQDTIPDGVVKVESPKKRVLGEKSDNRENILRNAEATPRQRKPRKLNYVEQILETDEGLRNPDISDYFGFASFSESHTEASPPKKTKVQKLEKKDVKLYEKKPVVLLVNIIKQMNENDLFFITEYEQYNKKSSVNIEPDGHSSSDEDEPKRESTEERDGHIRLFEDFESKPCKKTYGIKKLRRVRLQSHTSDEISTKEKKEKLKKQQEPKWDVDAEEWAESFNAMCQEVEQYELETE